MARLIQKKYQDQCDKIFKKFAYIIVDLANEEDERDRFDIETEEFLTSIRRKLIKKMKNFVRDLKRAHGIITVNTKLREPEFIQLVHNELMEWWATDFVEKITSTTVPIEIIRRDYIKPFVRYLSTGSTEHIRRYLGIPFRVY